jgi:hypothetical protein
MGYAAQMRFEAPDLALLDAAEEVEIETAAPDGAAHRTIIWLVVDGDDAFVRSVNGSGARWYREAVARPDAVAIHVGGRSLPARVESAADDASIERVSEALGRKYASSRASLRSMLAAHTLETTLRVIPRPAQA